MVEINANIGYLSEITKSLTLQGLRSDLKMVGLCIVLHSSLLPGQKIKCLWAEKCWDYSPPPGCAVHALRILILLCRKHFN